MRLLIIVLFIVLFVGLIGFVQANIETRVPFNVFDTVHEEVPLYLLVIGAIVIGIVFAGVIAVAEGAHIRLANRRLEREIRKLETELNYLRTQPPVGPRREPDELPDRSEPGVRPPRGADDAGAPPPSAPVYGGYDDDPDDETYSGGRAV